MTAQASTLSTASVPAVLNHNVGIKCVTITADKAHVNEFKLKQMRCSPNLTIRNILGSTEFHELIILKHILQTIPGWVKPIVISCHAYGDQSCVTDFVAPGPGKLQLVYTPEGGGKLMMLNVYEFKGKGVTLAVTFGIDY
ncbi:hypothetical protein EI94DRAFT_1808646 [Lactarius quietus]|nr:hypothetical protein EI94DRAFT_1808646 [Lactarius quietus]